MYVLRYLEFVRLRSCVCVLMCMCVHVCACKRVLCMCVCVCVRACMRRVCVCTHKGVHVYPTLISKIFVIIYTNHLHSCVIFVTFLCMTFSMCMH